MLKQRITRKIIKTLYHYMLMQESTIKEVNIIYYIITTNR